MNIKEIQKQLPKSWDEVTLQMFTKMTKSVINENYDGMDGIENTLEVISKITDIPQEELEALPFKDIIALGNHLSFMVKPPEHLKQSVIKWKKLDEITYNDYVSFLQIKDDYINTLPVFIKNFSLNEMTEDEILNLSIREVFTGFFLFRKQLLKYLNHSIASTRITLIKMMIKQKLKELLKRTK
jgi:hypothetical protein